MDPSLLQIIRYKASKLNRVIKSALYIHAFSIYVLAPTTSTSISTFTSVAVMAMQMEPLAESLRDYAH